MELNLKNIEELIFYDKKVRALLPEFRHYFDQWELGLKIPGMRALGQRNVIELLNSLKESHILKLEEHFKDIIVLNKIDHRLSTNLQASLDDTSNLCVLAGYRDFCVSRDADNVYISCWR